MHDTCGGPLSYTISSFIGVLKSFIKCRTFKEPVVHFFVTIAILLADINFSSNTDKEAHKASLSSKWLSIITFIDKLNAPARVL